MVRIMVSIFGLGIASLDAFLHCGLDGTIAYDATVPSWPYRSHCGIRNPCMLL